ncbi:MAG: transcriptional regulator [Saliniramus fredricksonii]|uniref:Transcriptional regulator n=1 Tax=Saliniramus fredricksonii TaxID=1653334 RepID=A0A0P7YAM1_9HYPH|nr:MAG: transcriptional regulator [Saliniramus fredricksonii]SCC78102.1 DNA-binding transcriptional regulator, MarR family [Saliniramus fredricksonii]
MSRNPARAEAPPVLDYETGAAMAPAEHAAELRLWLRLLTCSTMIEGEIRRRLRERFDVTLPRFDLMAQLDRTPEGLTLSELSQRMMVSNGNVTGLVERLVESGHLSRRKAAHDRRSHLVALTPQGREAFRAMAVEHEAWIADFFGDLDQGEIDGLMALLGKAKASTRRAVAAGIARPEEEDREDNP